MENNEVKITEHRYKQLLESARRERIMMEILMKAAIINAEITDKRNDPNIIAETARFTLETRWKVPFNILKSNAQLNGYDAAHELVIIHADMEPDFSIKRNP